MSAPAGEAIEASIEWHGPRARHVDRMVVAATSLQGDGRWLAAASGLPPDGEAWLDAAPWCQPSGQRLTGLTVADFLPAEPPRAGRHYPARAFGRALGSPRDLRPVRLAAIDAAAGRLVVDPNHPLAGSEVRLGLRRSRRIPAAGLRLAELFVGPGMQFTPPDPESAWLGEDAFGREDDSADAAFYAEPRLVQHLDAACRAEVGACYGRLLRPGMRVLDLMASHDSHLAPDAGVELAGLGMNAAELEANPRLAWRVRQDLNAEPTLPWPDASFDGAVCTAAIEYLVAPVAVLAEVRRVLRPGGFVAVGFSDRWFPPKAIRAWGRLHPFERHGLVIGWLHRAGFRELHGETLRGIARPADDRWIAQRAFADPLFAAWGYAPT